MCNQTGNIQAEKQLVDQILLGDTHAFRTLIKNTEGLVAQIVSRLLPNAEDRKDIVQDVAAFQPLGIHSLAIMSFSLAASFLAYYFFINHKSRQ